MIVQAEHIPVHLGAMPEAVAAVLRARPRSPARSTSSTTRTRAARTCRTSRSSRGRRSASQSPAPTTRTSAAMEPASLPAGSRELFQEGIVVPPTRLDDEMLELLLAEHAQSGRAPRRPPRADRRAPARGAPPRRAVRAPRAERSQPRWTSSTRTRSASSGRRSRACPTGATRPRDVLEPIDGELEIRVAVTIAGDEVEIDFAGTSPQHEGNLNCPLAVTRSACYFVVRCLTEPDLPASGGAFAPVTVRAPEGCLVNADLRLPSSPETPRRRAGSSTPSSARSAQAVPVPAQGQGTMNNVTFGNDRFTYYETIGGGQGACPDADGPSAVHVAMSNTLNTPVEALELAYPLRVERYGLRGGSGGAGRFRGGDGVIRELRVARGLPALDAQRAPRPGARRARAGGEGGAPGRDAPERGGASREGDDAASRRRRDPDRDARRRRLRPSAAVPSSDDYVLERAVGRGRAGALEPASGATSSSGPATRMIDGHEQRPDHGRVEDDPGGEADPELLDVRRPGSSRARRRRTSAPAPRSSRACPSARGRARPRAACPGARRTPRASGVSMNTS